MHVPRHILVPLIAGSFVSLAVAATVAGMAAGAPLFTPQARVMAPADPEALASAASQVIAPVTDAASNDPTVTPAPQPTVAATPQSAVTATVATPSPKQVTTVPVLMYHYIRELPVNTPDQLGYGLSVSPKLFEDELGYLAGAGYQSVSMADVTSHVTRGTPLPPKPIVLTFDDGYADFYTAALPLLDRYHFTATTYLVVNFLGKPGLHELAASR